MTTILTPEHPQWGEFITQLENSISPDRGCKNDFRHAEAIMIGFRNIDIQNTLNFFEDHGAFCDCEVTYNIALPPVIPGTRLQ